MRDGEIGESDINVAGGEEKEAEEGALCWNFGGFFKPAIGEIEIGAEGAGVDEAEGVHGREVLIDAKSENDESDNEIEPEITWAEFGEAGEMEELGDDEDGDAGDGSAIDDEDSVGEKSEEEGELKKVITGPLDEAIDEV